AVEAMYPHVAGRGNGRDVNATAQDDQPPFDPSVPGGGVVLLPRLAVVGEFHQAHGGLRPGGYGKQRVADAHDVATVDGLGQRAVLHPAAALQAIEVAQAPIFAWVHARDVQPPFDDLVVVRRLVLDLALLDETFLVEVVVPDVRRPAIQHDVAVPDV